mmetsp:Transcript_16685/g.47544  ORF Transcript_16685/g.47544 Transcript_16685/m.47544 type:complete len:258 (-) Transcript_16685:618-1391(-)
MTLLLPSGIAPPRRLSCTRPCVLSPATSRTAAPTSGAYRHNTHRVSSAMNAHRSDTARLYAVATTPLPASPATPGPPKSGSYTWQNTRRNTLLARPSAKAHCGLDVSDSAPSCAGILRIRLLSDGDAGSPRSTTFRYCRTSSPLMLSRSLSCREITLSKLSSATAAGSRFPRTAISRSTPSTDRSGSHDRVSKIACATCIAMSLSAPGSRCVGGTRSRSARSTTAILSANELLLCTAWTSSARCAAATARSSARRRI